MRIERKEEVNSSRMRLTEISPLKAPLVVNISLHEICNFRCNYCVHGNSLLPQFANKQMTFEEFKAIIDNLACLL